jgi:signal peptidase I
VTLAADDVPGRSPWLSIWLRPGDTIERVLAARPTYPHPYLLLLAVGGIAQTVLSLLIRAKIPVAALDWRFAAAGVVIALVIGVASLYLNALCLSWSGRIFGGHASPAPMRAVVAWGMAPLCAALVIDLVLIGGLTGEADNPASAAVIGALNVVNLVMPVWAMIATIVMLMRVQAFSWLGAIFSYFVGLALTALLVFVVLGFLVALPIRIFLFQPFSIPSGAMKPTMLIGDYFFVSKYAYGYSHFSLPFSPPVFAGRIFAGEPQRGDVVVFRLPKDPSTDYIKRVVGLPGDRIQMIGGLLHINGTPVKRERIEDFIDDENTDAPERVRQWRETLPNGVSHQTLDLEDNGFLDNTQEFVVPAGHYFMMGDNRDNSTDSRVLSQVGYVPFENIVGRAEIIYFSVNRSDKKHQAVRSERLGLPVR